MMTNVDPEGQFFSILYPHTNDGLLFLLTAVFIYFKISLHTSLNTLRCNSLRMTLLDVLGKIAWVRKDFLSQGKISDILIQCARTKTLIRLHVVISCINAHFIPYVYVSMSVLRRDSLYILYCVSLQWLPLVHVFGHLPLIVHITAGSLQFPSAVHVILATPVRSYPISHR